MPSEELKTDLNKNEINKNIEIINNENVNEISENNSSYKKYNSYLYESFSEKSSLTAYPNTEGSARLHKVYELLEMQRKPKNEENNNLPKNKLTHLHNRTGQKKQKKTCGRRWQCFNIKKVKLSKI